MALAALELSPQMQMQLRKGGLKVLQQGDSEKQWGNPDEARALWQDAIDHALRQGFKRGRMA